MNRFKIQVRTYKTYPGADCASDYNIIGIKLIFYQNKYNIYKKRYEIPYKVKKCVEYKELSKQNIT